MTNLNKAGATGQAAAWPDGSSLAIHRQHTDLSGMQPPRIDLADRIVMHACLLAAVLLPLEGSAT